MLFKCMERKTFGLPRVKLNYEVTYLNLRNEPSHGSDIEPVKSAAILKRICISIRLSKSQQNI